MARQESEEQPKDPWPKVLAAIRELREGHKIGRSVLRKFGPRADLGKYQMEQAAKEHGRTPDACRKLRQVAMLYRVKDLKELCGLCRQHRRAFGLSLLYKIVSVEDREDRREFQKAAIIGRWGHARLSRELRVRLGHRDEDRGRKQRGRKPYIAEDTTEVLAQIAEMTFRFLRWQEQFDEMVKQGHAERVPNVVARKLRRAITSAKALYDSAKAFSKSATL
jgi:hypothetical protein